jgi:hypothetical protein
LRGIFNTTSAHLRVVGRHCDPLEAVAPATLEIEEFRLEITAGAEVMNFTFRLDHWSDTAHHIRHPDQLSIGGREYALD